MPYSVLLQFHFAVVLFNSLHRYTYNDIIIKDPTEASVEYNADWLHCWTGCSCLVNSMWQSASLPFLFTFLWCVTFVITNTPEKQ